MNAEKFLGIGAAYYPELWDEGEIDEDIARCKELGVNVLRLGEFAWKTIEPKEGEYDFSWLQKIVEKLYQNGISTILCTPTCTPPRWLFKKYEETKCMDSTGRRAEIYARCHPCKTSPVMREKNRRIVTELAKAFVGKKGVIGWQIDNELFPYGLGCYCPLCKSAFHGYLRKKYGDVKTLNSAWGMDRWSLTYDEFEEVIPPVGERWEHPSLRKAWWDFQCEQIIAYSDEQAEILHAYSSLPVGTDMMRTMELSYNEINKKLDVVQFNHYERADELDALGMWFDFMRCVLDKPYWVTETQVGWNGSYAADSGYRPKGACYANTMLPFMLGGEMNLYWLFRAHPAGHELGHGALFSSAGRAYRVSEEVKKASEDLKKCEKFLLRSSVRSKIALHFSATASLSLQYAPLLKDINYVENVQNSYLALKHFNVDVIDTQHGLEGYEILLSPFLCTADENGLKERVLSWVERGGTWIVGPMTDIMDGDLKKYVHAPYSFVEELAGVYVRYQKPMDNDVFQAKWKDGTPCKIGKTFDAFTPLEGTEVLASYEGEEFDGLAVVTSRKVGKGRVILLGSRLSTEDLRKLIDRAPILKASDNLTLSERSGAEEGIFVAELRGEKGYVRLDGEYVELITGKTLSGRVEVNEYQTLALQKK